MTDIKLLRSFVKVMLSHDKDVFTSNMGNNYLHIKEYKIPHEYRLCLVSSNIHYRTFLSYDIFASTFRISSSDKSIKVSNLNDFVDFDDISLVLKYGRDILDDNIMAISNRRFSLYGLSLSDFDTFFIRMGMK